MPSNQLQEFFHSESGQEMNNLYQEAQRDDWHGQIIARPKSFLNKDRLDEIGLLFYELIQESFKVQACII